MIVDFLRRARTIPTIGRLVPLYATLGVLKHVVSLHELTRWAWKPQRGSRSSAQEHRVLVALTYLRKWFGHDTDCLQASLLLYRELSRMGAEPTLSVGFRQRDGRLQGHAWVVVDGRVIPAESYDLPFDAAMHFGRGGVLITKENG